MPTKPTTELETFPNPHPERDYIIEIETPEFTCLCPKTGQPDFATIRLEYVPDQSCVELKSLKLYYWSYRSEGAFHEKVTNTILSDLVAAMAPRYLCVEAIFNVRGGVYTTVTAEYRKSGWTPPPPAPDLPRETQELPIETRGIPEGAPVPTATSIAMEKGPQRFRMLRRRRRKDSPVISPAASVDTPHAHTGTVATPRPTPPKEPEAPAFQRTDPVYLGIDVGTTGCRVIAIDDQDNIVDQAGAPITMPQEEDDRVTQDPNLWWQAVQAALNKLFKNLDPQRVHTIAVDATSSTVLFCDHQGEPVSPALMYGDSRAKDEARKIAEAAEKESGSHGASSSLAKMLWLQAHKPGKKVAHICHQADWITGKLSGRWGHSDYNNCLKLGYYPDAREWPQWFSRLDVNTDLLPTVHAPGEKIGSLHPDVTRMFGMQPDTHVVAGTTDGVASFLAAGSHEPGQAVTSLGSTLVLKLLSDSPVFSPEHGIYSHRLGKHWLAGGASNSGGAVLLQYFKIQQMKEMTPMLDATTPTGLDYYPLPSVGERFPINDPGMVARLEPLPCDSVEFFQGMLEGMAAIEAQGYQLLHKLGATEAIEIRTTGGGSQNPAWETIRARILGIPIVKAQSQQAAFGCARLARGIAISI